MSEDPAGITVRGGAGGTRARLEELEAVERALRFAASCLAGAEAEHRALTAAVHGRQPSGPAAAALAPLAGPRGLGSAAQEAELLTDGIRGAAAAYAEADVDATAAIRGVTVLAARSLGEAGPIGWLLALGGAVRGAGLLAAIRLARWTATPLGVAVGWLGSPHVAGRDDLWGAAGRLVSGPGLMPAVPVPDRLAAEVGTAGLAAFLTGAMPGRAVPHADPVGSGARDALLLAAPWVPAMWLRVTPVGVSTTAPPKDEADVLDLVDAQYPDRGAAPGQVAVQRLDHADGDRSWVVAIPGTQDATLGGANPWDGLSDLEQVAGVVDDAARTVVRAMEMAGVGAAEPVLLAGHSLGGMVAARVAETSSYRVTAVLTAGSPVAGIEIPRTTQALHLEHAQDVVPGLRGLPNPDEVNRTTVVRDLAASGDPLEAATGSISAGISGAHDLGAYRRTADLLPAADPSVAAFRAGRDEVLTADVVSATTWTFTGERVSVTSAPSGGSAPPARR